LLKAEPTHPIGEIAKAVKPDYKMLPRAGADPKDVRKFLTSLDCSKPSPTSDRFVFAVYVTILASIVLVMSR
jgi:hypothetical protein